MIGNEEICIQRVHPKVNKMAPSVYRSGTLEAYMDTVDIVGATILIFAIGAGFGYYAVRIFFGV